MSLVRFRFWALPQERLPPRMRFHICGCSSMVEHQPSKLDTWVRFPSPAFCAKHSVCVANCRRSRQSGGIHPAVLRSKAGVFTQRFCEAKRGYSPSGFAKQGDSPQQYTREWLSGGAPPCQGGGRGFDPRLAL